MCTGTGIRRLPAAPPQALEAYPLLRVHHKLCWCVLGPGSGHVQAVPYLQSK